MENLKNTELLSAIYQIADERGLDHDVVISLVKKACLTAYKKMVKGTDEEVSKDDDQHLSVDIDPESGKITVLAEKKVVSVITDPRTQILESKAKLIDPRLREGDHIQIDVTPDNFGRIAAQAAYQRLKQGLRDAELETTMQKYVDKVGKIISGVIQRKDQNYIRVEVDKAEAIMPISEAIPGEFYKSSERKRFLLVRLQSSATDKRMVLSRGSADFLKALFEVEVPEISAGNVEIVNIAREAGSRSKVAVRSLHEKIDAIGACVGPKGTRIDSIMNEISPEKVDIILYNDDDQTYIINALSPAKIANIKLNQKQKSAIVLVTEDMLSLAIGKDGQNVRLAAKLTGYKIDITASKEEFESSDINKQKKVETEKKKSENKSSKISDLDLTERQLEALKKADVKTKE